VLTRAIARLDPSHHLAVISKFGLLEFRFGSAERGRTIFEGVLANYPRRLDLLSVFIDQECSLAQKMKAAASAAGMSASAHSKASTMTTAAHRKAALHWQQQLAVCRRLLDRACSLPISSKKAKFFFKRYLQFEQEYGNDSTVEAVKEKARQYVQSKVPTSSE